MAASGWSTSNFIRLSSALITGVPLTMACWAKTGTLSTQVMMGLYNSGSAAGNNQFRLGLSSSGTVRGAAQPGSSSSPNAVATAGSISANTWFHAAIAFPSNNSRSVYRDGGDKATVTTSATPSVNETTIGLEDGTGAGSPFLGSIAELGWWNVALSDEEIATLAKGISPLLIRPQNLVAYLPLWNNAFDFNGNAFAIQGSLSVAEHCRVYMPS